jgi:hypothetical protein
VPNIATPWKMEELEACFVVIDSTGQKLACASISRMIPAGDRRPSCSRRTRRGGSRRISGLCETSIDDAAVFDNVGYREKKIGDLSQLVRAVSGSSLCFFLFRLFCDFCPGPSHLSQNFAMLFRPSD